MPHIEPFFIQGYKGYLFCQCTLPKTKHPTKSVLLLPPFAEEMNKSRRMLSQQAWCLAERGYTVYMLDLYGTGDSAGEFSDATWEIWCRDIKDILQRISKDGFISVSILALRMGALLLEAVFESNEIEIDRVILWQPSISGEILLNQFLRLKLAADMISSAGSGMNTKEIKQKLTNGISMEIAGYSINPILADSISNTKLEKISFPPSIDVDWYELLAKEDRAVSVATQKVIDKLKGAGVNIRLKKIVGTSFWSTIELVDVHDLLKATTKLLS